MDTVLSIYGRELVDNLIEVEYEESYIKVWGYVTRPSIYRSSRKHQSYYVNDRYVKSQLLSRGVSEAYSNLLPDRRHPIVFLFIKINPIHVDVNVHPAKFEVKFSRPEMMMDVVAKGIRQSLIKADYLPTFKPMAKKTRQSQENEVELASLFEDKQISLDTGRDASMDASTVKVADANTDAYTGITFDKKNEKNYIQNSQSSSSRVAERLAKLDYQKENWDPLYRGVESKSKSIQGRIAPTKVRDLEKKNLEICNESDIMGQYSDNKNEVKKDVGVKQRHPELADDDLVDTSIQQVQKDQTTFNTPKGLGAFIAQLLPIGQIHKTYIIAESKDGLYVFDQHVVHERILYEDLMERFRKKGLPSQALLIPLTLELTLKEIQAIQQNIEIFNQLGFEIEHFGGNTVMVNAVPRRVDERPDKDLFLEIIDLILEEKKVSDRARLYNKLITIMACKGAIKAGEYLEQGEMIRLLQKLSKTENPRFCPHGRPIFFHISEHDLLKAFQRI